ncbi:MULTISPECIES: D-alanyl-D-alanine carboxypeptidase family protein [Bacillaceae]|nr:MULTISPECIES: D-alanyl-D-alanine carboxypeptidase family protein [Bacillaceae]
MKIRLIMLSILILFTMYHEPISANELPPAPNLVSEAAILIDSNTGKVLYQKNAHQEMYPASITKIITAIIAIETQNLDDMVIASWDAVRAIGTRVYLLEDEEVQLRQLLHGLMVSSGNDAAIAIAEHIDGSVEAFAERMNDFVQNKVGVTASNFSNPHGLFEEEHVTTASDMAKISAYAMKNETFRELVSTEYYDWVGEGWETRLYNHHPLTRGNDEIIGIKNGFVSMSGTTLVTAAKIDDTELISVTLKAPSRNAAATDTMNLMDYGFANYETEWISFEGEVELTHYVYPDVIPVTKRAGERLNYTITESGIVFIHGEERLLDEVLLPKRPLVSTNFLINNSQMHMKVNEDKRLWSNWLIKTGLHFYRRR